MATITNKVKNKTTIILGVVAASLLGCGGFVYTTIGGNVSGLTATSVLVLRNEGNYTTSLAADGPFSFRVASNGAYNIVVGTQPNPVNCTVVNGVGQMSGDTPLNNIVVTCLPNVPVGGVLTGLASGTTVALSNNGVYQSALTANAAFVLPTYVLNGSAYAVTVSTQPAAQVCSVTNGAGTALITNVAGAGNVGVNCVAAVPVAGTITGLNTGLTLILANNGADNLSRTAVGAFTFANSLLNGSPYLVTVATQPTGQTCTVTNASGTAALASPAGASNIAVNCVNN